ncbi:hypothetical protein DCAR_0102985 [Daucus carota subsp. sativus]|uniref:Uncharacterized protein n=1 Tax=Daucus carota subsp. sativus TaxID=79200 RepID=A0A166HFN5_DAUCS|nr:hypothetical protein DCAR_0102985 [Daucus carota subsp. sativus]
MARTEGQNPADNSSSGGRTTTHSNKDEDREKMIMSEKEILQHWFFLETEMVEAIMKGNKSLIPAARARVIFLSKVVKPDLVQEGVNGEEDALWKIHKVLHNKGWWEKARNLVISPPAQGEKTSDIDPLLLGFLRTNERYVHPNTRILLNDVEILSNVSEFECVDHTGTPLETKSSSENFHENQSQARSESHSSILDNNRNDETAIDSQDNGLHSVELLDGEDNAASENEVSTSLLNPPTPRYNVIPFPPYPKLDEAVTDNTIHTNLSNWKPRDHDSSVSLDCSPSEEEKSIVDDASVEDIDSLADSHPNIIKDLYNLKVKSRRGRPRNFAAKHINKHFRLPKRKKKKGEGLKQITHFCLNNNLDEGEAIYETGVLMGLLPVHSKEKSMELIRLNLKK